MHPFTIAQLPAPGITPVLNKAPGNVAAFPLTPRSLVTICLSQTIAAGSRLQIGIGRARSGVEAERASLPRDLVKPLLVAKSRDRDDRLGVRKHDVSPVSLSGDPAGLLAD